LDPFSEHTDEDLWKALEQVCCILKIFCSKYIDAVTDICRNKRSNFVIMSAANNCSHHSNKTTFYDQ